MVFPIADDNSDRRNFPVVNIVLIGINIFVFVFFQKLGNDDDFTYRFSTVPEEIVTGKDLVTPPTTVTNEITGEKVRVPGLLPTPGSVYFTLLMSMFMHGSIMHIAGNMWFLWIFGDNVEDALGPLRYLLFYLVSGLAASLAHVFLTVAVYGVHSQEADVPSLGASGAISGVMGGYLLLFPFKRVTVILFRLLTDVPAWVAVGIWFGFQVLSGLPMLGGQDTGGVAYAAHIGGFVAGLALVKVFAIGRDVEQGPTAAWYQPQRTRRRW
ncbi:MAG: rhomboid family intramembrane serine protease [Gemmataceae bacterium]|nr:rhomboid family intramembrane serine protease [Gemmataceae bacterium]